MAILNRFSAIPSLLRLDSVLCFSLRNFWRFLARDLGIVLFAIHDSVPLRSTGITPEKAKRLLSAKTAPQLRCTCSAKTAP